MAIASSTRQRVEAKPRGTRLADEVTDALIAALRERGWSVRRGSADAAAWRRPWVADRGPRSVYGSNLENVWRRISKDTAKE